MTDNNDFLEMVPVETGLPTPAAAAAEAIAQGRAVMKSEAGYHTAISVQRPRDWGRIVPAVMKEADYAGKDFYYSWSVMDRKTGKRQIIEGPSIGAAMALYREYGNCVLLVQVEDKGAHLIFTPRLIDLENGSSFERAYKFRPSQAPGKYDADRWADMQFQVAQSKAIRNVVTMAMPKWLLKQMVERAKKAELNAIDRVGLVESTARAIKFFEGLGVSKERLEFYLEKDSDNWTSENIATLRSVGAQARDGEIDLDREMPEPAAAKPAKESEKPAENPATQPEPPQDEPEPSTPPL